MPCYLDYDLVTTNGTLIIGRNDAAPAAARYGVFLFADYACLDAFPSRQEADAFFMDCHEVNARNLKLADAPDAPIPFLLA